MQSQSHTSTWSTYRHMQAQHEAAQGGTRRRSSGTETPRCSGAHQRMRMAMSLCSGPQHVASERRHRTQTTRKKAASTPPAPPTPARCAPRARPRCPPCSSCPLSCEHVDHAFTNHCSEAVLEHSRRSVVVCTTPEQCKHLSRCSRNAAPRAEAFIAAIRRAHRLAASIVHVVLVIAWRRRRDVHSRVCSARDALDGRCHVRVGRLEILCQYWSRRAVM